MPIKKYNPITPGTRTRIGNMYAEVTTDKPEKSLTSGKSKSGGRNHKGKMTMRHIGGGHKKKYRVIDFRRDKDNIPAKVKTIEYDPNRTAYIALVVYADGEKRYIIAPDKLTVGSEIISGEKATPDTGNALFLKNVPLGSPIHAIEMTPGKGAALARSAGTYGTLMSREGKYVIVKLPSGEVRRILSSCKATIGTTSNPDHGLTVLGKAAHIGCYELEWAEPDPQAPGYNNGKGYSTSVAFSQCQEYCNSNHNIFYGVKVGIKEISSLGNNP